MEAIGTVRRLLAALSVPAILLGASAPALAQDASEGAAAAFALVMTIVAVMLLSRTVLPIYVFFDADKRNYNPVVWVIMVAIFGLIPFFIYLAVRPKTPLPRYGYYYHPAAYPGQPYVVAAPPSAYYYSPPAASGGQGRQCRFCGTQGVPGEARCPNCGLRFG